MQRVRLVNACFHLLVIHKLVYFFVQDTVFHTVSPSILTVYQLHHKLADKKNTKQ